tara:strand:- start:63 stop:239 length:177 start_codon:yes stop_codon:yes gene_type:complete
MNEFNVLETKNNNDGTFTLLVELTDEFIEELCALLDTPNISDTDVAEVITEAVQQYVL